MNKKSKPIKKGEITTSYVICAVAMLASIICWFLPTVKADYFLGESLFNSRPEKIIFTFFSYNDSLKPAANIINLLFLVCSVASLVLVILPLIKNKVMSPNKALLFPAIVYLLYFVLFFIRYVNAKNNYLLYDIKITPVTIIYILSLVMAFSFSLTLFCYIPKLKKQQENESPVAE